MDKPFRRLHVINTELMLLEKILTTYYEPTRGAAWPCKCLSASFPERCGKCILRDGVGEGVSTGCVNIHTVVTKKMLLSDLNVQST